MHMYIHTHSLPMALSTVRFGSSNTLTAKNTPSIQIFVSKNHFLLKGTRFFGETLIQD